MLVALARAGGDIVSRDALIQCCWGGVPVSDHVYVKFDSPALSAPNAESVVFVTMTGDCDADAGFTIDGAEPSEIRFIASVASV